MKLKIHKCRFLYQFIEAEKELYQFDTHDMVPMCNSKIKIDRIR